LYLHLSHSFPDRHSLTNYEIQQQFFSCFINRAHPRFINFILTLTILKPY